MTTQADTPIFELFDLVQMFDGQVILDIEELTFTAGQIYCLYGPNGAGKTTLFEILTMLRPPTQGRLVFKGQEVFPRDDGQQALRFQVTLVHQDPLLFDTTVERNVDYGLRVRHVKKKARHARVRECLQLVGLDGFQKRKARTLSGGETQRVAIARALAINPAALLLDEFSANVDEASRHVLEAIIHTIRDELGTTIIFTTHYMDQAYRVADEVIHLFKGKPVQSPVKNVFHGRIEALNNGSSQFVNQRISLTVLPSPTGPASIALPSEHISISLHPLTGTSMRNNLPGRITHIIDAGHHIDLNVAAGESFSVTITREAFRELQLQPGLPVYLNFKASAVRVYED